MFSAFKVHHQQKAMTSLLFDKKGNKIPFSKWKKEALKISTHQNKHWLKTEYKTAIKRADMGAKFKKFEETKHLYPNLEWTPSRAETPDESHKKFWGMVLPLNDVFWNTNFPGDRWGCACNVKQTKKPVKRYIDDGSDNTSPKGLEGNPATTGAVFSGNHAFRKGVNEAIEKGIADEAEVLKLQVPYGKIDYTSKNGSTINIHPNADPDDFVENFRIAKIIADTHKGYHIKITPHVIIDGVKNPEFLINGIIADLKHQHGFNVGSNVKSAISQDCEIIVYELNDKSKFKSAYKLFTKVYGSLNSRSKHPIKKLIIIEKDGRVVFYEIPKKIKD